jgi:glutamyl-tRNA reductase
MTGFEQTTQIGIIGTSIWQQNLPLLEKLTLDRDTRGEKLTEIKERLGLDELVYLSTCNRVEFLFVHSSQQTTDRILHRLLDILLCGDKSVSFFPNDFYLYSNREAITHLFRTVASLESLVLGETQIVGQFKDAYMLAVEHSLVGPNLQRLSDEALVLAKRVRSETSLVSGSLSMASLAANELAGHIADRDDALIALVGSGEMTRKLARYIRDQKLGRMLFVNRTVERARAFAEEFDGEAISLDQFIAAPTRVDAILSATAAKQPVFGTEFCASLKMNGRKVVCVDLAIPRDFSTDFAGCEEITLVDIPYLKSRGNGNLRRKFVEASRANALVKDAVDSFLASRIHVSLKPIFQDSYLESLKLADNALNDLFDKKVTNLDDDGKEAVKRLVTKLIGHSSFQPARIISDKLVKADSAVAATPTPLPRKAI